MTGIVFADDSIGRRFAGRQRKSRVYDIIMAGHRNEPVVVDCRSLHESGSVCPKPAKGSAQPSPSTAYRSRVITLHLAGGGWGGEECCSVRRKILLKENLRLEFNQG